MTARFDRVVRLVEGFETPFGPELLATVHWVAAQEHASSKVEVERATHGWAPRKRQFPSSQIALAVERLQDGGRFSL